MLVPWVTLQPAHCEHPRDLRKRPPWPRRRRRAIERLEKGPQALSDEKDGRRALELAEYVAGRAKRLLAASG
jgi:hypothetical protein